MVVIAISGPPGSGKTTIAKLVAEYFKLNYFSAGRVFREIASMRGVSIEELSIIAEKDPSIDLEIDKRSYEEALKGNVVLDGHLTAWIVKDIADFKIYLTAPLLIRVSRISKRDNISFEQAFRQTIIRENTQWKRFIEYYGIDTRDLSIFNLVLDVSMINIEETFNIVREFIEKNLKSKQVI
uniref:Cytidylate kinase n=1 Tax=Staphylothermus marinus TaxID=2280 RepID=A0A7J3PKR9_STAMA